MREVSASHWINFDDCITESIDDDPLLGLMKLMLGDALPMSHDGMTHASLALDEAEHCDLILIPAA